MDKKNKKKLLTVALVGVFLLILWIVFLIWYLGNNFAPLSPEEQEKREVAEQGKSDQYFSGEEKKFFDEHPWFNNLPQSTEKYFLFYHPIEKAFIADLYLPENAEQNEINQIKSEINDFLRSQGIEVNKSKIIWNLVGEPSPEL